MRYTVLSIRTIAVWAVLIVAAGVGMAVWLLLAYTGGDTEANQLRLDAIRTAGTVVVGTGGGAALLLAARRQRTAEITLAQKDRDQADATRTHALQERVAASTAADAEARRITDLYTKSADQLGSEKAPVRLAGLYALERLAQDNPGQRQTIANVPCAYLRMPFALSGDSPADDELVTTHREHTQEREVRLAAQRILIHHLRPGENPDDPDETFWADIDLDLTGAALINLNLDFAPFGTRNSLKPPLLGTPVSPESPSLTTRCSTGHLHQHGQVHRGQLQPHRVVRRRHLHWHRAVTRLSPS